MTDPELPYTRAAFTPLDHQARAWLTERMREAGLSVRVDAAGNLIGRLAGARDDGPVLMLGSHTDTVQAGGRFDGIIGVLGGLEVVRCLGEAGVTLSRPLELVNFTCEEPTIVSLSPLGSRVMAGDVTPEQASKAQTPSGQRLADAIDDLGGDAAHLERARRKRGDIAGYLELHIEQGPELERQGLEVGVVTAVAAPCRGIVTLTGAADHAGATLMPDRHDALTGASELVLAVERIVSTPDLVHESVGTVGALRVSPNMVNVIPGHVEMTVEVRSTQINALTWAMESIEEELQAIGKRRGLATTIDWMHLEEPVSIPDVMQDAVTQACDDLGIAYLRLPSRASHDAARLAPIANVGMVFIPCKDGRSHCPEEWAELGQIVTGTRVLGQALLRLDQMAALA